MTSDPYNPNDAAFLISRALDGELSAEERAALDRALTASPELGDEADQLRSVAGLVSRWGRRTVSIDWETHGRLIDGAVREVPDADTDAKLDAALAGWRVSRPRASEDDFADAVLAKIGTRRRVPIAGRILKWGMPLAAAAVFALVVSTAFWTLPGGEPVSVVRMGPSEGAGLGFRPSEQSVVSFARTASGDGSDEGSGIGLMTLGASPAVVQGWSDVAPI